MREPPQPSELLPLAWCGCYGGLIACGLFWLSHDPPFAALSAGVALVSGIGVAALLGRR
jgi:hypothetical protein